MIKRMTIEIDEQLLDRAKRALGTRTIRATVEEALRRAVDSAESEVEAWAALQRQEPSDTAHIRNRVTLPLVMVAHAARPEEEITPERAAEILLDDEAESHRDPVR